MTPDQLGEYIWSAGLAVIGVLIIGWFAITMSGLSDWVESLFAEPEDDDDPDNTDTKDNI